MSAEVLMKSNDLKKWLKAAGISREELAKRCRVSKRTVDGWFQREDVPEPAGTLIERIMTESIQMSLTIEEFKKILELMRKSQINSVEEFVNLAVREKIAKETPKR